jgi:hypothetical protein
MDPSTATSKDPGLRSTISMVLFPLLGCTQGTIDAQLELDTTRCEASDFAALTTLSVDLYGRGSESLCVLNRDCVPVREPLESAEDLQQLLAEEALVQGPIDGVVGVAVVGLVGRSCWTKNAPAMFGFDDINNVGDGTVEILLECPGLDPNVVELCP